MMSDRVRSLIGRRVRFVTHDFDGIVGCPQFGDIGVVVAEDHPGAEPGDFRVRWVYVQLPWIDGDCQLPGETQECAWYVDGPDATLEVLP